KHTPFHLEIVKSAKTLIAVFKVNFETIGEQARPHTMCPECEKECGFSTKNDIKRPACSTKFRRIEDAKLSIADLEPEISLLSIGPAEPKQRSSRLLDLIQRVRINTPPLKPLEVEPTCRT
ncbi:hypothetical protein V498_04656, partial [Pseudogymnoascus sp. VKM F-4517 (FW-2822)]